jgi:hypothetical protein
MGSGHSLQALENPMRLVRCLWLSLSLAFSILGASTVSSQAWVRCGNEGGDCVLNGTGHNFVRYGAEQSYFMIEMQGVDRIGCNNYIFGDPASGKGKSCEYMNAPPEANSFARCGDEGGNCALPDTPRRVRYGVGNKWIYKIASGTLPCNNDFFSDVAHGQGKHCESSTTPFSLGKDSQTFRDCGTEGSGACQVGDGTDPVLVRYGTGTTWKYSRGTTESVDCGNDTFGDPAPGQTKFCQVAILPPQITDVVGRWKKAGDCQNCSSLSRQVQVGISGSRSNTVTNSFTNEVSVALESSMTFEGIGEKESISAKTSTTEAKAVTDALTRQQTETMTANCSSAPTEKLEMFQWAVDVDELCYVSGGQCKSTVSQFRILCVHDQPNGFKPICPPSMCKDANCTQCTQ